ncbi:MAG TPA: hypothetical protein VG146_01230 [Verrucomicrobiae bacterium]|nr:hypothetical protein [Verrucomicrobiae bacterium]
MVTQLSVERIELVWWLISGPDPSFVQKIIRRKGRNHFVDG